LCANSFNKNRIYLFLAIAIAGFLTAFLIFWNSPGDQKGRPFTIKSNKPFYQTQKLPKGTSTQAGALFSGRLQKDTPLVKKDIKGPVQGKVTLIDWCSNTFFIDDVPFNTGSLDLVGKIQMGDRVEVTYTDPKQGKVKVMESIHLLH
jgi:hypothetical protein